MSEKERLYVLCLMDITVGSETKQMLCWYQSQVEGEVTVGTKFTIVNVIWDGMLDMAGWEKVGTTELVLNDYLYNKYKKAW